MKLIPATIGALLVVAALTRPASAQLSSVVNESGRITLSVDGLGIGGTSGSIQVNKPSSQASVRGAYFMAAGLAAITNSDITLAGSPVSWTQAVVSSFFNNVFADVTAIVKPILDPAPAGINLLTVTEAAGVWWIDGTVLAVIFDDPSLPATVDRGVILLFGRLSSAGDSFLISVANPLHPNASDALADMGLGISFSMQGATGSGQISIVDVNSTRLTSSAGGEDDGGSFNGMLITAGGVGDSNANPPPFAPSTSLSTDDELYNLLPFIQDGDTSIRVDTLNPSDDDNVFFSYFLSNEPLSINGIELEPPLTLGVPVGATKTLTATVTENGVAISGSTVNFSVDGGPNAGMTGTDTTDALGHATFSYASSSTGTDTVSANCVDSFGVTLDSNDASVEWIIPPVCCDCGASTWSESFDAYTLGSAAEGQGSWDGLCTATPSSVTAAHSFSPPHSVEISLTADLVQTFQGYASGKWTFRAMQHIPSATFTESTWFRLLHFHAGTCFPYSGPHQSVEVEFDPLAAQWRLYKNCGVVATGSLYFDQWVELRAEIDLDNNLVRVFYGGVQVAPADSWYSAGACPNPVGPNEFQAAKFTSYGVDPASKVYYDCLSLSPLVEPVIIDVVAGGGCLTVPKVVAIDPNDLVIGRLSNALAHGLDTGSRVATWASLWFTENNPTTGPAAIMVPINPLGGPDTEICATMQSSLNGVYPYDAEVLDQNFVSLCTIDPELVAGTAITTYCTAKVNSQGCTPAMSFAGAPSPSFGSGFTISATNVLNNKSGLLFYGRNGAFAAPFQGGLLCVRTPVRRTSIQSSHGNSGPNDCSGVYSVDFNTYISSGNDSALVSGVTVNAQYWSRDPGFAPPFSTGLTDAIQFTIP